MRNALRKVAYANETKRLLKEALSLSGVNVSDSDSFRSYIEKVDSLGGEKEPSNSPLKFTSCKVEDATGNRCAAAGKAPLSAFIELLEADWSFTSELLASKTHLKYFFSEYMGKQLDLSNFVVPDKVTDISYMFESCSNVESLTLPESFEASNVTNMSYMFRSCYALKTIDLSNLNVSEATNMSYMFYYCNKLETVNFIKSSLEKLTNLKNMFYSCENLKSIDLSNINTSNITNMSDMFYQCVRLTDIVFSNNWASNKSITSFALNHCPLSKNTLYDLANAIADKSDTSVYTGTYTIKLSSTSKKLCTEAEQQELVALFNSKNWTVGW